MKWLAIGGGAAGRNPFNMMEYIRRSPGRLRHTHGVLDAHRYAHGCADAGTQRADLRFVAGAYSANSKNL